MGQIKTQNILENKVKMVEKQKKNG